MELSLCRVVASAVVSGFTPGRIDRGGSVGHLADLMHCRSLIISRQLER